MRHLAGALTSQINYRGGLVSAKRTNGGSAVRRNGTSTEKTCASALAATTTLASARQRSYFINSRDDPFNLGKEGFLAILRSMSISECGL